MKELPEKRRYEYPCELVAMVMRIPTAIAKKPNFRSYTYLDDMVASANVAVLRGLQIYDPDRSKSLFSYLLTATTNAFLQVINAEKRQVWIRHEVATEELTLTEEACWDGLTKADIRQLTEGHQAVEESMSPRTLRKFERARAYRKKHAHA